MIILPATAPRKPKLLFPDRSLMLPNLRHTLQIRNQQKHNLTEQLYGFLQQEKNTTAFPTAEE